MLVNLVLFVVVIDWVCWWGCDSVELVIVVILVLLELMWWEGDRFFVVEFKECIKLVVLLMSVVMVVI